MDPQLSSSAPGLRLPWPLGLSSKLPGPGGSRPEPEGPPALAQAQALGGGVGG